MYMLRTKDILDEKDPRVRAKNTNIEFPLNEEYKKELFFLLNNAYSSPRQIITLLTLKSTFLA